MAGTMIPQAAAICINTELLQKTLTRWAVEPEGDDGPFIVQHTWSIHGLYNEGLQVARLLVQHAATYGGPPEAVTYGEAMACADKMDAAYCLLLAADTVIWDAQHTTHEGNAAAMRELEALMAEWQAQHHGE